MPSLLERVASQGSRSGIGFYDKKGRHTWLTYSELKLKAESAAGGLYKTGLGKGDKLIIATRDNSETIQLLWAAFLLGAVPTILQPPVQTSGYNPSLVKLSKVFELLHKPYIFISRAPQDTGDIPADRFRYPDELESNGRFPAPGLKPEDLAFIQFSSGSTGEPKGIMLSHRNLILNMDAISCGLDLKPGDIFGNWMPLFHDMGLIGYHLVPLYAILSQFQVETTDFIMNPLLWLNMMSEQGVTVAGCTNFGLNLALRYFHRREPETGWNFKDLKALLIGAEPISVKTMRDFTKDLGPFGLKPEAMMPVYGLAEATLAATFPGLPAVPVSTAFNADILDYEQIAVTVDETDLTARLLTEVGKPIHDVSIRIVDDNDNELDEGFAGHIQLMGPVITSGYYENPGATASAFCGEWLRTGDMGFIYGGRLYISGRFKDIIFRNGSHFFANDLEEMAVSLDEIKQGKVCFGGFTDTGTEAEKVLAFVAGLTEQKAQETFDRLRNMLRSRLGITVDEMVMLRSNEIPKTSSGKLQRYKLIQRYLNGEFEGRIVLPSES